MGTPGHRMTRQEPEQSASRNNAYHEQNPALHEKGLTVERMPTRP
jgi:hypothetical protein